MKRKAHPASIVLVCLYTALVLFPIGWMVLTSVKDPGDTMLRNPKLIPARQGVRDSVKFRPTLENFAGIFERAGAWHGLLNSAIVAPISTVASVFLGAFAAYGFSRFRVAGSKDWQFFILSTRMLPALAVSVPISWMYAKLDHLAGTAILTDTTFGLILLYTCFNLSFSTWMMKAFMDEVPIAYEEAALLDGYSRVQVLFKIVLPQVMAGLLATAVFCLIAAWNEFAFALILTKKHANTMPVFLDAIAGDTSKVPIGRLAAGAVLFMTPIVLFGLLMRKHLLRGVTFGAVKG